MRGMRLGLAVMLLALLIGPTSIAAPHSLAELKKSQPEPISAVPEPIPGKGCPVPPIPDDHKYVEGEGWSIGHLIAWRNFDLSGMRYYIEYGILRVGNDGRIITTPFPLSYLIDLNRNGIFDMGAEVFLDTQGNGRCADIRLAPMGDERKPHE